MTSSDLAKYCINDTKRSAVSLRQLSFLFYVAVKSCVCCLIVIIIIIHCPPRAQTPLIRFVVDLLYSLLYDKSTTNRKLYNKSTIS